MTKLGQRTVFALGMLLWLGACNEIAGINEPTLRGEGGAPAAPCTKVADCKIEDPECRSATCEQGACVFHDEPAGTTLSKQTKGDCVLRTCDGAGRVRIEPLPTDVLDDGNPCTLDMCEGTVPTHTIQEQVPCYTGSPETRAVGDCRDGVQKCDAQGNPVGGCVGEVVPGVESCLAVGDEDCDGLANEEGAGCVCVPGEVQDCYTGPPATKDVGICHGGKQVCKATGIAYEDCEGEQTPNVEICDAAKVDENCDGQANEGLPSCTCGNGVLDAATEQCDDGNMDDTDGCTNACTLPVCGDKITQLGNGEQCDGEPECLPTCKWPTVTKLFAGGSHACALFGQGRTKCWGSNAFGQLGRGDTNHRGDAANEMGANLPAISLGTGKVVSGLGPGPYHTCAWLNDGSVKCWGLNNFGQLGLGNTNRRGDDPNEMGSSLPAVSLGAGQSVTAVRAGDYHTCAIVSSGAVKCWGRNDSGRLGLGDTSHRGDAPNEMGSSLPVVDLGGSFAKAITAGGSHTCALLVGSTADTDGSIKCWGFNGHGQLGLGNTSNRGDVPNEMGSSLPWVGLGTTAKAVAAGYEHTCAILTSGAVKCWGRNDAGQLGLGDTNDRGDQSNEMGSNLKTVALGTGRTAKAISAGHSHTCALLDNSTVKCWGLNDAGQLGLGDTKKRGDQLNEMGDNLPVVDLGTGRTAKAISAGRNFTCALLDDSTIKCWGRNDAGQLGLGDTNSRGDQPGEVGDNLPSVKLFSSQW